MGSVNGAACILYGIIADDTAVHGKNRLFPQRHGTAHEYPVISGNLPAVHGDSAILRQDRAIVLVKSLSCNAPLLLCNPYTVLQKQLGSVLHRNSVI